TASEICTAPASAPAIVTASAFWAVLPGSPSSDATTVKLNAPVASGVPSRVIVLPFPNSDSPWGSAPASTLQANVGPAPPPFSASAWLYGDPTLPPASDVVVIEIAEA